MDWSAWIKSTARIAKSNKKTSKPTTPWQQLVCILDHTATKLVLDVGANRGQYADSLRQHGYLGEIRSFEPLPDLNRDLAARSQHDPNWHVDPPMVIGAENGRIEFSRSAEDDMSSVLPQAELQARISPSSAVIERLELDQIRLDRLLGQLTAPTHLKVDVQGYESAVLDGAGDLLHAFSSIQLEMALVPIYQGEVLWQDMVGRLESAGFDLHLVIPGYFERKIARQLQIDGVFVNRRSGLA